MKTISVKNKDLGFWTQEPISVKRMETINDEGEQEVIYCNHDGAEEREVENETYRADQPDIVWTSRPLICECGAYKLEGDNYWQDAPVEGKHE